MSCVLRVMGRRTSVEAFLAKSRLDAIPARSRTASRFAVNITVSAAPMDDFASQVKDALAFLSRHKRTLHRLAQDPGVARVTVDFAVEQKTGMASQSTTIPAELIRLASLAGIAIEISHYAVKFAKRRVS